MNLKVKVFVEADFANKFACICFSFFCLRSSWSYFTVLTSNSHVETSASQVVNAREIETSVIFRLAIRLLVYDDSVHRRTLSSRKCRHLTLDMLQIRRPRLDYLIECFFSISNDSQRIGFLVL